MNSKDELHQAVIMIVVPTSSLQAEQGELPAFLDKGARGREDVAGGDSGHMGGLDAAGSGKRQSRKSRVLALFLVLACHM